MASTDAGPSSSIFQVVTHSSTLSAPSSCSASAFRPASHHVHLSGHSQYPDEDQDDDQGGDAADYSTGKRLATPGQILGSLSTYMRGHGTHLIPSTHPSQPSQIASSLTGRVILTNRLLSLQPFYTRYSPETGDLVLGRVLSVLPGARRWKISLGASSLSNLALSAINLPGGIQRRKVSSDELQMRTFFKEGDLLVAEVQGVYNDGSTSLHTRSLRYGKLRNGRLVCVPSRLIRRGKSHFIRLKQGSGKLVEEVDMILGLNGWIWLSAVGAMQGSDTSSSSTALNGDGDQEDEDRGGRGVGRDVDAGGTYSDQLKLPPPETLSTLSTLVSLLALLSSAYLPISDQSIQLGWDVASAIRQDGDVRNEDSMEVDGATDYWSVVLHRIKEELSRSGEIGSTSTSGDYGHRRTKMEEDDDY